MGSRFSQSEANGAGDSVLSCCVDRSPAAANGAGGSSEKVASSGDEGGQVKFLNVSEYESSGSGKVVHIKGFSRGLDFDKVHNEALRDRAVELIADMEPDTLVWDADSFSEDSFTCLVPRVVKASRRKLRLVMFGRASDRNRIDASWSPMRLPAMTCYLCPSENFEDLGSTGLSATRAKTIVTLGGGRVVKVEFERGPQDVIWHLVPVSRLVGAAAEAKSRGLVDDAATPAFKATERSPLEEVEAPNLRLVDID